MQLSFPLSLSSPDNVCLYCLATHTTSLKVYSLVCRTVGNCLSIVVKIRVFLYFCKGYLWGGAKTRRYYPLACAPTKSRKRIGVDYHCYITCVSQARWIYYILLYYYFISINLLYNIHQTCSLEFVYGRWYMIMAHVKGLWYSSESSDNTIMAMEIIT